MIILFQLIHTLKEKKETIDPEVVKKEFLEALSDVVKAEDKFKALLIKGGYINEQ